MALEHREPFLVVQGTLPLQSRSCPVGPHLWGWKGVTVRDTSAPSVSGLPCYSCDNILMSVRPKHTLFSCHSQEKKTMFTCSQEAYTPGSQHSLPPNKCQLILKFSESTKHVRWVSRNSPCSRTVQVFPATHWRNTGRFEIKENTDTISVLAQCLVKPFWRKTNLSALSSEIIRMNSMTRWSFILSSSFSQLIVMEHKSQSARRRAFVWVQQC